MKDIFFISDRTGITTEGLGNALLTQFESIIFRKEIMPFIDTLYKADQAIVKITNRYMQDGTKPIVITSIINPEIRNKFKLDYVCHMDFFESFIPKLENEIGKPASLVNHMVLVMKTNIIKELMQLTIHYLMMMG